MTTFWLFLLRVALSLVIKAVAQIPEERWTELSDLIIGFLTKIQDKLPAGSPVLTAFSSYRAPTSKLARPHDNL